MMKRASVLFLVCVLRLYVECSHFRGAVIQWKPVYSGSVFTGEIEISHQISWTRTSTEGGSCDDTQVAQMTLLGSDLDVLFCDMGCSTILGSMQYYCTDFSVSEDWAIGQRTYTANGVFGVSYFEAVFGGFAWTFLVLGGNSLGWNIRLRGDLTVRADTGRVNASPTTSLPPNIKFIHGCNNSITIPVNDVDGDVIRCRWASASNECDDICNGFPAVLSSEHCSLQVEPMNTSVGFYVAAVQIEDFTTPGSTTALSSVPLQFLVEFIDSTGLSCDSRPEFVGDTPLDDSCLAIAVGDMYTARLTAKATPSTSIVEIATVSPLGLQRSDLQAGDTGEWYVDITWSPMTSQTGPNILCFTARDNIGIFSKQFCITLLVGGEAPEVLPSSVSPSGIVTVQNASDWSVEFSLPFTRPTESRYIRIISADGAVSVSIDASISNCVTYPPTNVTRVLQFSIEPILMPGVTYYVSLDSGVATSQDICHIESPALTDPFVWTITIDVPNPCLSSSPCDSNAVCVRDESQTETFTCTCSTGYSGDGFTCLIDCGGLASPDNGMIILNGTVEGSLASYSCSLGYNVVGNDTRTCEFSGLWSEQPPTCQRVECGSLTSPNNGTVIFSETLYQFYATYVCDIGFLLSGVNVRLCQANAQWSDAEPECFESANCSDGDVRLVNGPSALEGHVEVCSNGEWGTVCDDSWGIEDANVVCAQLGFGEAIGAPCAVYYGAGTGQVVLDDLGCVGGESSLFECSHNGIGNHNCNHQEDASAVCSERTPCLNGDIRLAGGSNPIEGRVELCYDGEWGTICDDNFDTTDALVVCRQLRYNGTSATVRQCCTDYAFGQGNGSILLDEVGCTGSETSLLNCSHNGVQNHDCTHANDVGIICSISYSCVDGDVRLVNGPSALEGRVEVCSNGEWGTVCDDSWGIEDANVTCTQLGFGGAHGALERAHFGQGLGSIVLDDVGCVGNEESLFECAHVGADAHNCVHCEDAAVSCTVVDPCLSSPCDVNAQCARDSLFTDTFSCTCNPEYTGDGFNCTGDHPLSSFFPFGAAEGDATVVRNNNFHSDPITLVTGLFPMLESAFSILYVNNSGDISFNLPFTEWNPRAFPFSASSPLIAPFWADIDTTPSDGGEVTYRETTDTQILERAQNDIQAVFPSINFNPTFLFIATWNRVGFYPIRTDLRNTFQCILVANSTTSFVIFLYADIQWTTADSSSGVNGFGGNAANAGLNGGDGSISVTLPGSQMPGIANVSLTSNVGKPSAWIFRTDQTDFIWPDPCLLGPCDSNATCLREGEFSGEFACICNSGFSGDGFTCFIACGSLTNPGDGMVLLGGTILGSLATYTCSVGHHLVGNDTRTCQSDTTWSGAAPVCQPVDCGALAHPNNGSVALPETVFQSLANYTCDSGYLLTGIDTRVCQEDGQWSGTEPMCIAICSNLTDPDNGQVSLTGTLDGSVANYTCSVGHNVVGNDTRTCQSDTIWSGAAPVCQAVDCGTLPHPNNGSIALSERVFQSLANYTCDSGYLLTGIDTRVCQEDGQWSGAEPMCIATCSNLTDPDNGQVSLTGTLDGSVANYTCSVGHNVVGNDTRTCQSDTIWSGAAPVCQAVDCGALPHPNNGSVALSKTVFQSLANYTCDFGYLLTGNDTRMCQEGGQWSGAEPVCIADCGNLIDPVNGVVALNSTLEGATATYMCNEGLIHSNGDLTRLCTNSGRWSGLTPVCALPDPCLEMPCDKNAVCEREELLSDMFNCTCTPPFEGSGFNCSVPNPCLSEPCDVNALCTRNGSNFTCACSPGYTDDGFNCVVPDPCLNDPCAANATCARENVLNANFSCNCIPPFFGDGFNCTVRPTSILERYRDVIISVPSSFFGLVALIVLIGVLSGYVQVVKLFIRNNLQVKGTDNEKLL